VIIGELLNIYFDDALFTSGILIERDVGNVAFKILFFIGLHLIHLVCTNPPNCRAQEPEKYILYIWKSRNFQTSLPGNWAVCCSLAQTTTKSCEL